MHRQFQHYPTSNKSIFRPSDWRVTVNELQHAVLIRDGRVVRTLDAGRHRVHPLREVVWTVPSFEQTITVPGQEMLTSDGAGVRATVSATLAVTDALAAYRHGNWQGALYLEIQLALRDAIGAASLDEILSQRNGLDDVMTQQVLRDQASLGVEVSAIRVRDLVTPGELKRSVAEVVQARLSGQAALERARGESAALRSLANAARAVADNPALLQLRMIQQMENSRGNTYVIGAAMAPSLGNPS